jgi:hypothetical protein
MSALQTQIVAFLWFTVLSLLFIICFMCVVAFKTRRQHGDLPSPTVFLSQEAATAVCSAINRQPRPWQHVGNKQGTCGTAIGSDQ